ncbi:hypothetical protein GE115_08265 [Agromyces sp. CFH 90414]|uniref:MSP domain-containing protein n=1 Tax=Agromyces agglutinans TaxID=2662258 RepID=A0A6I2F6D3_9MICO|nr:hypothetical protein [Agromyces agglutinans]MRG59861.1 hypothetical protein [Agromyces agglutinans]
MVDDSQRVAAARVASVRRAVAASMALAALAMLAACSSAATDDPSSAEPGASMVAPVVVDLAEVDGTTIEVDAGNVIDLTGDDETYTAWTADIADESIATFIPGRDDGSAQFDPGIEALAPGETEVVLENGETGDVVEFTVEVTEAS